MGTPNCAVRSANIGFVPATMTRPVIQGWGSQWYGKDPDLWKVCVKLAPGGIILESNSGMLLWAVCQSESSFFHMTVLFTPIMSLMSDGVKPSRGFRLDPAVMITTTGVGAVCWMLNGLKPVSIITPAAQSIRISPSKARVFFLRFLFLGNKQTPGQ
jgi:hypothetical protein